MELRLLFLGLITATVSEAGFKDYIYADELNAFYKFYSGKTFKEAIQTCIDDDAHLVVPTSEFEANYLTKRYQYFWIGVNDKYHEGHFLPIDSADPAKVYLNWAIGEPNNAGDNEHCAELVHFAINNDVNCSKTKNAVCKKTWGIPTYVEKEKPKYRKDYIYVAQLDNLYKYHGKPLTFSDAASKCMESGATLFIPRTSQEANFARIYTQSEMWIGVHDLNTEGTFETVDGSSFSDVYLKWDKDEPKCDDTDNNCVIFTTDRKNKNVRCDEKRRFLCKKSPDDIRWNSDCETYIPDYVYDHAMRRCYKYHSTNENWQGARDNCACENASLIVINSQMEANIIKKVILEEVPLYIDSIHAGFDDKVFGKFITIDGLHLKDAGYNAWAPGKPERPEKKFNCGGLNRDSLLTNQDCSYELPYICEKSTSKSLLDLRFGN